MFDQVLRELLNASGAELAVLCDAEGEEIAEAHRSGETYDARVQGAQLGPVAMELREAAPTSLGRDRLTVRCLAEQGVLLLELLPGGYYLLLRLADAKSEARARRLLVAAATQLLPEF